MLTAEIIRKSLPTPLHLRPNEMLEDELVSSKSRWLDPIWWLDNPSIGQRPLASKVTWEMQLPDGRNLIDPEHAELLGWLRRFVWSLFVDPRDKAKAYKPGNGSQLTQGLRIFVPWMVERGHVWPKEIDKAAVAAFIDDLPSIIAVEIDDEEVIREGAAYMPLKVIDLLWRQRSALKEAGISPMPERPWADEKGANSIVRRVSTEARGWIRPLPDEVAIPIVNKAAWFLGDPADDVVKLWNMVVKQSSRRGSHPNGPGATRQSRLRHVKRVLHAYVFARIGEDIDPWHESLAKFDGTQKFGSSLALRRLMSAVAGAACITIQSTTGMRASEICALLAGVNSKTGLPAGVRVVETSSGLNEAFVLTSELTKGKEAPRDVDWLLGMRPKGSDDVPLAVRAIRILDQLFAYPRSLVNSNRLLVSISTGHGVNLNSESVTVFDSLRLNDLIKEFVTRWVDLSALPDESSHRISDNDLVPWRESNGSIIRSQQFRKTYAQFALSIDPRLLPAVQRQYHHVALAITEGGYWGRNRIQIEPMNAMSSQLTAMQLYEMATGRTKAAGKMGVRLHERIEEVRKLLDGVGMQVGWRRVMRFVRDNSLHMWFSPHGNCFPMNSENMGCHKAAATRPIGLPTPNFATREPSLCAGCDCFIFDLRHVGFWQDRYVTNAVAHAQAEARGHGGMFRVAEARAVVARKLLERLGVDIGPLDARVKRELADVRC